MSHEASSQNRSPLQLEEDVYNLKPELEDTAAERQDFPVMEDGSEWLPRQYDGQLAVDVYETDEAIVVKAPIAGVRPEDLDISIHNDMLIIRGYRENVEEVKEEKFYCRECYWGGFSRSIIMPVDIDTSRIEATMEHGVLTVRLPKAPAPSSSKIPVTFVEE